MTGILNKTQEDIKIAPTMAPVDVNSFTTALPPITGAKNTSSNSNQTNVLNAVSPTVSSRPSLDDYISQAKKLGLEQYAAIGEQLKQSAEKTGDIVARKVYGQNVGAQSGLGKEIVSKSLAPILEYQQAEGNKIAAQLSMDALNRYYNDQSKLDSQNNDRLNKLIDLTKSGNYKMSDSDSAFLASQGLSGKILTDAEVNQSEFKRLLKNKYGVDTKTGEEYPSEQAALDAIEANGFSRKIAQKYGVKENGQPYPSEKEAEDDWERRSGAGEMVRKFGINPNTGKPFASEVEGALFWAAKEADQNLSLEDKQIIQNRTAKFGVKPDGTTFKSDLEAEAFEKQQQIDRKYGKRADGSSFQSEEEAIANWDNKQFNQKLIQKYGVSPSGLPWPSEEAAIAFLEKQGANAMLLQKYGTDMYGNPYKTEADAIRGEEEKKLNQAKKNITDPTLKAMIGSLEEYNFYLETGKTFEGEIADIMRSSSTLEAWKSKLPAIQEGIDRISRQINSEISRGRSKDQMKLDYLIEQREVLKGVINDIYGGKIPVISNAELPVYNGEGLNVVPTEEEIKAGLSPRMNAPVEVNKANDPNSNFNQKIVQNRPDTAILETFQESYPGSGVFNVVQQKIPFNKVNASFEPIIWSNTDNMPVYQLSDQYGRFMFDQTKRGYVRR